MFQRAINKVFLEWKNRKKRKPLVIRGARQVGKTSAVNLFAKDSFKTYIYINLEQEDNLVLFSKMNPIHELIQAIQLKFNTKIIPGSTIIFIDEIQNSSIAMNQLRYFYEEMPDLHVVAAGSLLEVKMKSEGFSFPVGRVEYCYMHPVTFEEFLAAVQETETLRYLNSIKSNDKIPSEIHTTLIKKYQEYLLVGGMPEAVALYAETRSLIDVDPVYESLLTGFKDDVLKYASLAKAKYIQYLIEHSSKYIGLPVKYENFGGSGFRSREMSEAFDVLEKAMVISRVYASASRQLPIVNNLKKSPKLLYLDTGLVNYQVGLRTEIMNIQNINAVYHGQLSEQIVGQTLLSQAIRKNINLSYWYREQRGSISEIDYLISSHNKLIPVEVKSGKSGTLRSLHNFIDENRNNFAIRIYSGVIGIEKIRTPNKKQFTLFSIPFYLLHRIEQLLDGVL
ncbi:MAG: AAA family ATPase [Thermodesulfovibrionales bacterium]|nr:AAA family ATPase [Thermodesulfovibrionales bacterium]